MKSDGKEVAKITYTIYRVNDNGTYMKLNDVLQTNAEVLAAYDILLKTDGSGEYTDGSTPFTMTQNVFQKSQTFLLPFTARLEDDSVVTDSDKYFRNQDDLGWFKHEIFWARDDEKVANCAGTETDCYNYLIGARSDPLAL